MRIFLHSEESVQIVATLSSLTILEAYSALTILTGAYVSSVSSFFFSIKNCHSKIDLSHPSYTFNSKERKINATLEHFEVGSERLQVKNN